jgi:hypothetical protein
LWYAESKFSAGAVMGSATYRLSVDDVIEAYQAVYRRALASWRGLVWYLLFTMVLSAVLTLVMTGISGMPWQTNVLAAIVWVMLMLVVYLVINLHVAVPAMARRQLGSNRIFKSDIVTQWTPEQLEARSDSGSVNAQWSDFRHYTETPRLLVLAGQAGEAHRILPKQAIGAAGITEIKAHLAKHNVRPASFANA